MSNEPDVTVIGSLNLDLVVGVDHHPATGETVLGRDHQRIPGGKGANQAVAAARMGAKVAMVGRVGADDAGATLLSALEGDGVDSALVTSADRPSGLALITVDADGDNAIVVSPGANGALDPDDVERARDLLTASAVTLVQLEVPLDAVARATQLATGTVVLNPAPAQPLPAWLLAEIDVIVPNQGEAEALTGRADPRAAAGQLLDEGVGAVVVTVGPEGAIVVTPDGTESIPAPSVTVVDTTAAGDAFCGALAARLAAGDGLTSATQISVRAGALAVTRPGAQPSLPTAGELGL